MLNKFNISQGKPKLIVYIVLTLVTLAVYWQVNQFDFINFDDNNYVTENAHVQSGLTLNGVRWALGTRYAETWTPLLWLSFMLDNQLYGLNAGGYHLTNLILHILSSLLLFWLFNRMTSEIWKSAFVAALFALHPFHVESVAWVTERKDVLSAFFWMLTLCLYVYYTEKPAIKRYLLILFGFVLALMSKPMVVTLPVVMILLDYWPLKRFESKKGNLILWQLKEKIPLFVLSAIFFTVLVTSPEPEWKHFPFFLRLFNGLVSFVTYLGKTFWPNNLAVFYPFTAHIPLWHVLGAALLILVISVAVIVMAKRLPYLFVGWMWFTMVIFPVSGIIFQIWLCAMADRYHYLPSIGLTIMMAWGIPLLFPNEEIRKKILFPMGILFIAILSFITWKQCGYWKNSNTLFSHALKVTKNNFLAHGNYASALYQEGKIDEALYHYNKAIQLKPDDEDDKIYNSRGAIYYMKNQYQLAMDDYNKALSLNAACYRAYNNRGIVYANLGRYQLAIEDFNKAILFKPDFSDAYSNRAFIYYKQGNKFLCCTNAKKACEYGKCEIWKATVGEGFCR